MMSHLDEVISPGLIELDLKGNNKENIIEELTNLMVREHKLHSKAEYIEKVYEREATISTYCGSEVAIPHAVSSAVKIPAVCFGRSKGLYWDSADESVRFVFLFAMPEEHKDADHLAIMSAVARCSLDPEIREVWLNATTAKQVLESLQHSVNTSAGLDNSTTGK